MSEIIEGYKKLLRERLSDRKYRHTLSVGDEAVKLAKIYKADPDKAYMAGLLHDITKEEPYEKQLELCARFAISLDQYDRRVPKILHAMTGAGFARVVLGVRDEDVLSAIYYHTTGRENMTLLEKIIYLADYVEPLRDFEGVDRVREWVYDDLDKALLIALTATTEEVIERGSIVSLNTIKARNFLICRSMEEQ